MLKRVLLIIMAVLILPLGAISVRADSLPIERASTPAETYPTGLARFCPNDSIVYLSLRTDEAYFETLIGIASTISQKMTGRALPSAAALIQLGLANTGVDYQREVRPWLGDRAAFCIAKVREIMMDNANPLQSEGLLILQVKDKAAAETFVDKVVKMLSLPVAKEGTDILRWKGEQSPLTVELHDDILLIGTNSGVAQTLLLDTKLDLTDSFKEVASLLPGENNLFLYVDLPQYVSITQDILTRNSITPTADLQRQLAIAGIGKLGIAGSFADADKTLVLDIAVAVDPEKVAALGFTGTRPLQEGWKRGIPRSSLFLVSADFPALLKGLFAAATEGAAQEAQVMAAFKQATGLDLQADILDNLSDADYALWVNYVPDASGISIFDTSVDPSLKGSLTGVAFGVAANIKDAEKGKALAANLRKLLEAGAAQGQPITFGTESMGGMTFNTVSFESPTLDAPVTFVLDYIQDTFFFATMNNLVIASGGDDVLFEQAEALILPDATSFWFMDGTGLQMLGEGYTAIIIATGRIFRNIAMSIQQTPTPQAGADPELAAEKAQFEAAKVTFKALAEVIQLGTISTASTAKGDALLRLTLTVGE